MHAFFERRFFLSLLAGKLNNFQKDVSKKKIIKNWRMRIISACIFLSFLAGKFKILKKVMPRKQFEQNVIN